MTRNPHDLAGQVGERVVLSLWRMGSGLIVRGVCVREGPHPTTAAAGV